MSKKLYKDPFSGKKYISEKSCIIAIERDYPEQLKALNVTARQAIFNHRNRLPINNQFGRSALSGKPTQWNEKAGRYQRFSDESERTRYREIFLERMRRVHGRDHLLDSPEQQRKMLANRSISGVYRFTDGTQKSYTGNEEKSLLEFLDKTLEWPGSDIFCPAPQNFRYRDSEGRERFYIPDLYVESLNLIVEVKGEMHNGYRKRDIHIEHAKDNVLKTSGYAFVKVEDRSYFDLMDALIAARERLENNEV